MEKRATIFYYIFIILIFLVYSIRSTILIEFDDFSVLLYSSFLFIFVKLIFTKYQNKDLFKIIPLGFIGLISLYFTREIQILLAILMIIGSKNTNFNTTLKITFWTRLSVSSLIMFLSSFNIIENRIFQHVRENDVVLRNSLGFVHPNQLGLIFFNLICLYLLIYKPRIKIITFGIIFSFNFFVYYLTMSRTSFVMVNVMLIGWMVEKLIFKFKISYFLNILIFPSLLSISYILPTLPRTPLIRNLDHLLQFRITLSTFFIENFGVPLFGQVLNLNQFSHMFIFLDSSYLNLILRYGIIVTILFVLFTYLINKQSFLRKNYTLMLVSSIIAIYGFFENIIFSMFLNVVIFYWSHIIFDFESKEK